MQVTSSSTSGSCAVATTDKWTSCLAGSDARHSTVGTRIDFASLIHLSVQRPGRPALPSGIVEPQEVELRAVLVLAR
jgi:hypothetical protein